MAVAGSKTLKYGGNTACVEIKSGNTIIICDAGTGIRPLEMTRATILLSHLHLDHVIGLPFFEPIYKKDNRFIIMSPGRSSSKLKSDIKKLISPPYFPINLLKVPAALRFKTFPRGPIKIGNVIALSFRCNHPDNSFAFKFRFPNGKVLVHASDNEPSPKIDATLIRWLKDADILIHDAQYTPKQYKNKIGWGHSPFTYPIMLAASAGIKRLFLFHYDPSTTDRELDKVASKVRKFIKKYKLDVKVDLSHEGMKIRI